MESIVDDGTNINMKYGRTSRLQRPTVSGYERLNVSGDRDSQQGTVRTDVLYDSHKAIRS